MHNLETARRQQKDKVCVLEGVRHWGLSLEEGKRPLNRGGVVCQGMSQ